MPRHSPPSSSFAANVLTMMTGTAVAQVIPLLASPLLTRLYTPTDFAVLAVFVSLAGPLFVLGTGRYELAVMLPASEQDAADVAWLALGLSGVIALALGGVVWLFHQPIAALLGNPAVSTWLYGLPLAVVLNAICQVCNYWFNRHQQYRQMAGVAVTQQGSGAAAMIALGWAGASGGLVAGTLAGQSVAAGVSAWRALRWDGAPFGAPSPRRLRNAAFRYRQFPAFNLPYSLMASFASGFVVLALSTFHHIAAAGFLGLARRMVLAPVTLLGASLGQVFFKEAAVSFGTQRLENLTNRLLIAIAEIGVPCFAFFAFWAPDAFAIIFGEAWREAGSFAVAFLPVAFCFLFTSWPERIYEIAQKQHRALTIQVIADVVCMALVWGLLQGGIAPVKAVAAYAIVNTVYHAVYLYFVFRTAGFRTKGLSNLLRTIVLIGAGWGGVLVLIGASGAPDVWRASVGLLLLGGYAGWWWKVRWPELLKAARP